MELNLLVLGIIWNSDPKKKRNNLKYTSHNYIFPFATLSVQVSITSKSVYKSNHLVHTYGALLHLQ